MQFQIKAKNLQLTDGIEEYLDKKMNTLDKFIDKNDTSLKCQVEVERMKAHNKSDDMYRSEINVHIAGGDFRAEASRPKLYDAIEETRKQMSKELGRNKTKRLKSVRQGGVKIKEMIQSSGNTSAE